MARVRIVVERTEAEYSEVELVAPERDVESLKRLLARASAAAYQIIDSRDVT